MKAARKLFQFAAIGLLAVAGSNGAAAQTATHRTLTLEGAERVITAAKAQAQKVQAPGGVIAVVDDGGNLMALERLDNTFNAGASISIGKARTAVQFKKPTKVFEDIIRNGRTPMIALADFTPLQGGVPIIVDGEVVGGVGVSGATTQQQDEELAIAGANALAEVPGTTNSASPADVTYFEKKTVDAGFAKGAVLFDGGHGRNYMIHASRREKPGQAEIHTKDADLIYVLEGTATVVTGGEAIGAKTTEANELRGVSIRGGQTRTITKGDVMIIPNNVPHQFLEVTQPFLYYVVKVR
jgi:uncharacterized protein GlcG (DUF336 family)/quercetin dioxygenase-like cupin family protein